MTDLYKEVVENIDFELDADEEQKAHKYCKSLRLMAGILTIAIVLFGLFAIYCIHADIRWGFYAFLFFAIFCIVFSKFYKKKYAVRVVKLINNDCDVSKGLTAHLVMLQYSRRGEKCDTILSCIGSGLFYMGKFEECKKIITLFDKYCDTLVGKAYALSLQAMLALYEKDINAINNCINEYETIMSQSSAQYITAAYGIISNYPAILEAEESGNYTKMTELLKTDDKKDPVLKQISANYRLYKVAKVAGMEAEASKHRTFVLEHGGDTFYKKELENIK